jgi:hypothetical protein
MAEAIMANPNYAGMKIEGSGSDPDVSIRHFDPRAEVSADAKYIVKNLVLWFLVLPLLIGILVAGIAAEVSH